MSDANKSVVRRWFKEGMEKGNLDISDELFADAYVLQMPGVTATGPEGLRELATSYRTAFPDLQFTNFDQMAEGDRVVSKWTAQGTHSGPLDGIAPTGKSVTVTGITISRLEGGKVVEDWQNFDELGMLRQIGAVPPA